MKTRPVGVELFHADGKTFGQIDRQGRHDEANTRFFANLRRRIKKPHPELIFICVNLVHTLMLFAKSYINLYHSVPCDFNAQDSSTLHTFWPELWFCTP
jgi:hypothetical protein